MNKIIQKASVGISTIAIMVSSFMIPAMASNNGADQIGPIAGTSADGGTCGSPWANDTYNLFFTVHNNNDGTFAVRTDYKDASFVTTGPASPGACETTNHHGSLVTPGITGNFHGFVNGSVTSSTYNPNACSVTPATCTTRTDAINTIFGAGAVYNITSYNFEYNSSDPLLQYHSWHENFNKNSTSEQDIGDIATQ